MNASDSKTGTVSCGTTVNLGTASNATVIIGIIVGGNDVRANSANNTSVTVTRNTSNTKADGDVALTTSGSAGTYAADTGSTVSLDLTAQDNGHANGNHVGAFSGTLTVTFHSGGKTIQVASIVITQVVEDENLEQAVVSATATVTDGTDPHHPAVLDNAALAEGVGFEPTVTRSATTVFKFVPCTPYPFCMAVANSRQGTLECVLQA